MKGPKTQTKV